MCFVRGTMKAMTSSRTMMNAEARGIMCRRGIFYLCFLVICVAVPGWGLEREAGRVYVEAWRGKSCRVLLSRRLSQPVLAPSPPSLLGEWTSTSCETRDGPEFVLRKYRFSEDGAFLVEQFHFQDPDCARPSHALTARGAIRYVRDSWQVPGAAEMTYYVTQADVIPYTYEAAARFQQLMTSHCPELGQSHLKPFHRQLIFSAPPEPFDVDDDNVLDDDDKGDVNSIDDDDDEEVKVNWEGGVGDIRDCMLPFNFSLHEMQLAREEIRFHSRHHASWQQQQEEEQEEQERQRKEETEEGWDHIGDPEEVRGHGRGHVRVRELLLGSLHSTPSLRHSHRPTSFQTPLREAEAEGCRVCARVANSHVFSPPQLHARHGSILALQGNWVSTRCESREQGMFLTRRLGFPKSQPGQWEGRYDFFYDALCGEPSFTLMADGSYSGGNLSSSLPGAQDYIFQVTTLRVTPRDLKTVEALNAYQGGGCGQDGGWAINQEQDVTGTRGCVTLGIRLPAVEREVLRMELHHRRLLLYVGRRLTGEMGSTQERLVRPTSFQEPLEACDLEDDVRVGLDSEGERLLKSGVAMKVVMEEEKQREREEKRREREEREKKEEEEFLMMNDARAAGAVFARRNWEYPALQPVAGPKVPLAMGRSGASRTVGAWVTFLPLSLLLHAFVLAQ